MARNAKQGPEQPATVAMSARARTESDGRSEGGRDCGTRSDGGRAGRRNGTCTSWRRTRERHRWSLRQGTATEGIHLGAVAGAGDLVQRALTGIEVSGDMPRLSPQLREEVNRLDMRMCSHEPEAPPIWFAVKDRMCGFAGDGARMFRLGSAAQSSVGSGHS